MHIDKTGAEHAIPHLRDIRIHLDMLIKGKRDMVDNEAIKQIEFDMYEIGLHLGFSPREINDVHTPRQDQKR